MKKTYRLFILLLFLTSFLAVAPPGFAPKSAQATDGAQLISSKVISKPIAAGNYLFWVDSRSQFISPKGSSIYGYDLTINQEFLVKDSIENKGPLASDGRTLCWVEDHGSTGNSIEGYTLASHTNYTIIGASGSMFVSIALDASLLYYQGGTFEDSGLYAYNLANDSGPQLIEAWS